MTDDHRRVTDRVPDDAVDRIVAQWRRERPELDTAAMAVFGRIYRLARLLGDQQEHIYNRHGIGRGEFDVLAALRRSGAPYQLSPTALSASLMLTTGGMTGRLDRLERADLVTRSPHTDDRRALIVTLTNKGRRLVDDAVVAGLDVQRAVLDRLPKTHRTQLADLLRELMSAAEPGPDSSPSD